MAFSRRTLNRTAMRDVPNIRVFVSMEKRDGCWVVCTRKWEDKKEAKGTKGFFKRKNDAMREAKRLAALINTDVIIKT